MKIENPHWKSHLEWSHNWPVTGCLSRRDSSDVVEKGKVVGRWRAQFLQDRQLPYCRNTNFRKLPQRVLRRKKLWRVSIFKDGLRLRKSSPTIKYVKISQNSNIRTSELKQIYNNICNIYIIYIYIISIKYHQTIQDFAFCNRRSRWVWPCVPEQSGPQWVDPAQPTSGRSPEALPLTAAWRNWKSHDLATEKKTCLMVI